MKIIPDQAHCEFLILNASIDAGGRSTEDSAFVGVGVLSCGILPNFDTFFSHCPKQYR